MRNLLIFVVAGIVGVAYHILRRPVTEVFYNDRDVRTKDGEIRMRYPPIAESHKIHQHLTAILGVIPHVYEISTGAKRAALKYDGTTAQPRPNTDGTTDGTAGALVAIIRRLAIRVATRPGADPE